jgi:hypothetical protein
VKAPEVLGEVVSPGETLASFSLTVFLGTVNVRDVVAGLVVPCDIGFAAEEPFGQPILVQAVLVLAVHPIVDNSPTNS